ncbi:MAG: hypothetical protein WBG57_06095 [Ornithinimicrobium sp.]
MNTTRTRATAVLAGLVLTMSGCSFLNASSSETDEPSKDQATSTTTVKPYDADEATATAKAMEADAYKQGEEAYRQLLDLAPDRDKPMPDEASQYATQRYIDKLDETREFIYADGRYSEGSTVIEAVTPVSYVQHGNPGWRMTMDFCIKSEVTLYESDGSISDTQLVTPDGEPLKPGEASRSVVTVNYLHDDGTWRANARSQAAVKSC